MRYWFDLLFFEYDVYYISLIVMHVSERINQYMGTLIIFVIITQQLLKKKKIHFYIIFFNTVICETFIEIFEPILIKKICGIS